MSHNSKIAKVLLLKSQEKCSRPPFFLIGSATQEVRLPPHNMVKLIIKLIQG